MALKDFYESLSDLIDKYAEVYMGLAKSITKFPSYPPPTGTAMVLLEEFLDDIQDEIDEDHGKESLKNILAEIEELTARTLYKLKNLK